MSDKIRTITIVIPTCNEEDNVMHAYEEVSRILTNELPAYGWTILFIDNASTDNTRDLIRMLAHKDKQHVKAIFNISNFGYLRSQFHGLVNADGDCVVMLHADLQNPPALIPEFVKKWEEGCSVVLGIKIPERENPIMMISRKLYYDIMGKIAQTPHVKNFADFFLLDKDFVEIMKQLDDPVPYLRGIITEFGHKVGEIKYQRRPRARGKSKIRFFTAYDIAMDGITSTSKALLRSATFMGGILAIICVVIAILTLIRKIMFWDSMAVGSAAISIGIFFIGAVVLIYLGIMGEYILSINQRVLNRPQVIEEERINL